MSPNSACPVSFRDFGGGCRLTPWTMTWCRVVAAGRYQFGVLMIDTRNIETAPGMVFDVSVGGPEAGPLVLMLHGSMWACVRLTYRTLLRRGKQDEKTYCLTGECSSDVELCA